jgi:hypothetical protein
MPTLLITHPACLDHLRPAGHPERPDRLRAIMPVGVLHRHFVAGESHQPRAAFGMKLMERCA